MCELWGMHTYLDEVVSVRAAKMAALEGSLESKLSTKWIFNVDMQKNPPNLRESPLSKGCQTMMDHLVRND